MRNVYKLSRKHVGQFNPSAERSIGNSVCRVGRYSVRSVENIATVNENVDEQPELSICRLSTHTYFSLLIINSPSTFWIAFSSLSSIIASSIQTFNTCLLWGNHLNKAIIVTTPERNVQRCPVRLPWSINDYVKPTYPIFSKSVLWKE